MAEAPKEQAAAEQAPTNEPNLVLDDVTGEKVSKK